MSYCEKSSVSSYEKWSGVAQFMAGQIGKKIAGPADGAIGVFLTGQNTWVARTADLFDRIDKGIARPVDYAEVASTTATLLATYGVLAGLAAPGFLTAATVAGIALTAYTIYQEYQNDCYDDVFNDFKDKFNRDGKYHVYDPITLDLNNDGIQALATNGFAGALFDHDNDGIRTATGWVNKEDGLLVRDVNGNGIIDNGSELFGDNTRLADGSLAAHGYVALVELDSNSDGKVDALDGAFNELKVWIDANSDGISQASELRTLMDLDIQSLDVAYQDVNQNLGNGNSIRQSGSYTKTDGSTAQMGDAWFASDKLYSRFTDKIDMTAEQAGAANDERYFQAA